VMRFLMPRPLALRCPEPAHRGRGGLGKSLAWLDPPDPVFTISQQELIDPTQCERPTHPRAPALGLLRLAIG